MKKLARRVKLWERRAEYWFHLHTDDALFGALMLGCFVMQVVIFIRR